MNIVNLTPHAVTVEDVHGVVRIIEPTKPAARVRMDPGPEVTKVNDIPVHGPHVFAGIVNLPPRREGTIYIVSQLTAIAVSALYPGRDDVVYPGTAFADDAERRFPDDPSKGDVSRVVKIRRLIKANA